MSSSIDFGWLAALFQVSVLSRGWGGWVGEIKNKANSVELELGLNLAKSCSAGTRYCKRQVLVRGSMHIHAYSLFRSKSHSNSFATEKFNLMQLCDKNGSPINRKPIKSL